MPSADNCSNLDLDCGPTVRYTIQCDYPERPNFGPDKNGAFFGDVELGRIVQEEHVDPLRSTSTASPTPTPTLLYHPFTHNSHFTPNGSLVNTGTPAHHSSSSPAGLQYDYAPHRDRPNAYVIADQAAFVSEYAELNENPDSRSQRIQTGPDRHNSAPPDYVRISVVLLLFAPPCASLALFWALKAKKYMKRRENDKAWLLSNKAFYCLLLGLLCFLVIIMSISIGRLVELFSKKSGQSQTKENTTMAPYPTTKTNHNPVDRFLKATSITEDREPKSKDEALVNIVPQSVVTSGQSENPSTTTTTTRPIMSQRRRGGNKRNRANRPGPEQLRHSSPSDDSEDIVSDSLPSRNTGNRNSPGENPDSELSTSRVDVQNTQVPKVTQRERSNFEKFVGNRSLLPVETTTIHPDFLRGVPIGPVHQASDIPRQLRHRRNVRQRPRGRRKLI